MKLIIDLSDKQYFNLEEALNEYEKVNIIELDICGCDFEQNDLSFLEKLTSLEILNLSGITIKGKTLSTIDNISFENLTNIREIYLKHTDVQNISSIMKCKKLHILDLECSSINSLAGLEQLSDLGELYISSTNISDLSPIKNHQNLYSLYSSDCPIDDSIIPIIASLPKLKILCLTEVPIYL
jgi:hypothetical protein